MRTRFAASKRGPRGARSLAQRLHSQCDEAQVKHGARLSFAIASTLVGLGACAGMGTDSAGDDDYAPSAGTGSNSGGSGGLPPGKGVDQPPEHELEQTFRVPVVSGHWVWTANPSSGRVALIDAKTFTVRTALAGAAPTYLTALPAEHDGSRALVISTSSQDASLLSARDSGEIEVSATLPVHANANAWAVTPSGRFAIAWTDGAAVTSPDPSQGFQDITVLDLAGPVPTSKRLSVGFRPARIFVDDDDRHVYVATDAGIDVVDLLSDEGPVVEREVELSAHPANDTARREVSVTPNGDYAFVRRDGQTFVTVVDIGRGTFKDIELPGIVTDLDLTPDAQLAIAIIRERINPAVDSAAGAGTGGEGARTNADAVGGAGAAGGADVELGMAGAHDVSAAGTGGTAPQPQPEHRSLAVRLPVSTIFEEPSAFDQVELDEVFGSVEMGTSGDSALLFANGVPSTRLTLLGLDTSAHRTLDLKLPVLSAVSSPDGAHAIALLMPPPGSAQPGAFAVVPVAKSLPPKLQGTLAPTAPPDRSTSPDAMLAVGNERALVTVSNGSNVNVSYLVSMPELTVDVFELDSVPLPHASGLVPEANQAFVAQQHPEGRITFIDLDSKQRRTLTGFELSTKVGK